jgi:two-component system, OmpR family, KDP operon response regulator KdpE
MTRILIADDEPGLTRALAINLRAHGYDIDAARDGSSALTAAGRRPPDLVILDLGLPELDGVDVVRGLPDG